jgi:tetratricopeptide (TPR) repeat protein
VVSERRRGLCSLLVARHLSTSPVGRARRGAIALASLLLVALSMARASTAGASDAVRPSIDAGDRAWSLRAEGAEGDRAAPGPIADAIAAYEAALAADPRNLEALWKLERALHFQGQFTEMSAADRERLWERGTELAERSLGVLHGDDGWQDREPGTVAAAVADPALGAAVHFWAAVHWGLWGETKGSLAAVHKGIAKRIRDHALIAIALDETFERGGPRRLLGRLHSVAPRVPLFTGWVSRSEGIEHLERAVAIAPEELTNRLYLAEARLELEPAHRDQALREIEAVVAAAPARDNLVEDRRVQAHARAALERARDESP